MSFDLFGKTAGELVNCAGVQVVKRGHVSQGEELLIAPLLDRYSKIQAQETGPDLLTVFKIHCALAAILMRRTMAAMAEEEKAARTKCSEKLMSDVPKGTVEALANFLLNERAEWQESEEATEGKQSTSTGQPTSPSSKNSTASPSTDSQPDSPATDAGKVPKASSTAAKPKSSSRSKNASE